MASVNPDLVLADTGPIVAILDTSDSQHKTCVEWLRSIRAPLLTCWPVITEAAWLLRSREQATQKLLNGFDQGTFKLLDLTQRDMPAIAAVLARYNSLGLQFADASLLHLANREAINTIFTLDRRDFSVVRQSSGKRLRLIP